MARIIDLSAPIEENQPIYPGHRQTVSWTESTHEETAHRFQRQVEGRPATVDRMLKEERAGSDDRHALVKGLMLSEHGPTHVDALSHFDPSRTDDGSIDQLSLDQFYRSTVCLDVSHVDPDEWITTDVLGAVLDKQDLTIADGDGVLLYTGHYDRNYSTTDLDKKDAYMYEYTGLDREAAYWLGERGIKILGVDTPSPDHSKVMETKEYVSHDMSAEYDCLHIENMANLGEVAGERFTLAAFPLKIVGGTGSPVRPVAILEE